MDYLNFKVSSELKSILGRDLIINDYIAILELVKNSYDAYATLVEIRFEDDRIVISDNGKGMSLTDIKEKWLFVDIAAMVSRGTGRRREQEIAYVYTIQYQEINN